MKKILIADDDKKVASALSARLNSAGYETLVAHTGFEAMDTAIKDQPDLIIMDIWMPGMGLSVAERLKEVGSRIPVIIMTASTKKGLWAAAQEVQAAAFIQKPYEPQELLETIERILISAAARA